MRILWSNTQKVEENKVKNNFRFGKASELALAAKLTVMGYNVSIPVVDLPYDLVSEKDGTFVRIQVKSTRNKEWKNSYRCTVQAKRVGGSVDPSLSEIVAVHLIEVDTWYIIPTEKLSSVVKIILNPNKKNTKFGMYKERWDILNMKHESSEQ